MFENNFFLFTGGIGSIRGDSGSGSVGTYTSTRAGGGGNGMVRKVMGGKKKVGGNIDSIQMLDSQVPDRTNAIDHRVISNPTSDKNV
jgi:hypothetical protein